MGCRIPQTPPSGRRQPTRVAAPLSAGRRPVWPSALLLLPLPLAGCLVPDGPFQGAVANAVEPLPNAPVQAYAIDPLSGARMPLTGGSPVAPDARTDRLAAEAEVASFASDAHHPLFELVRSDMAQLMRSGRAINLQTAYDQAVATRRARYKAAVASPPQH